jgi:maltose-binding protein MalE
MKNLFIIMAISSLFFSCTKGVEKPAITIGHYSKQVDQINQVVEKLLSESNIKVMHDMADGVEETRAIPCDAVGDECNVYYQFLSRVVTLTNDGELSEADRLDLELYKEKLQIEIKKSDVKLQNEWKNYINAEKRN